jgi:hypothetical protein
MHSAGLSAGLQHGDFSAKRRHGTHFQTNPAAPIGRFWARRQGAQHTIVGQQCFIKVRSGQSAGIASGGIPWPALMVSLSPLTKMSLYSALACGRAPAVEGDFVLLEQVRMPSLFCFTTVSFAAHHLGKRPSSPRRL